MIGLRAIFSSSGSLWLAIISAGLVLTPFPRPALAQPGGWSPTPGSIAGSGQHCPAPGQWLLLYWTGLTTPIDQAARFCSEADRFWSNRQGRWLGFTSAAPQVSDSWMVLTGEASFIRGGPQAAPGGRSASVAAESTGLLELERARARSREGRYEEAVALYRALLDQLPPEVQLRARLELAVVLLDARQPAEARDVLVTLPPGRSVEAAYLLGRAFAALGQPEEAISAYRRYVESNGPATAYARIAAVALLEATGRNAEALAQARAALVSDLPGPVRRQLLFAAGRLAEAAGDLATAREMYSIVLAGDAPANDRATALFRLGQVARLQGDPQWSDFLLTIVRDYPRVAVSRQALDLLVEGGVIVDPLLQGIVRYLAHEDDRALTAFQTVLDSQPSSSRAAIALFYLGAILERREQYPEAIARYAASQASDPEGPLADDARWWRAVLLESLGQLNEAATAYQEMAQRYPQSNFAADAAFRGGFMLYRNGQQRDAAAYWSRLAEGRGKEAARAALWQGKALAAVGDRSGAEAAWARALTLAPDTLYGLRAGALRGDADPLVAPAATPLFPPPAPNFDRIRRWVTTWAEGTFPLSSELTADPHWKLGEALLALGEVRWAWDEFRVLATRAAADPLRLTALAEAYHQRGLTSLASETATRLVRLAPAASQPPPDDLVRLRYPVDYLEVVNSAAARHRVPAALVLAMILQESLFDPRAGSPAGALGLMQIIPSTAQEIAAALGRAGFNVNDLYRPVVSIDFGAYYLAQQLTAFAGNGYAALAAYNGGPGNAGRWWRQAGNDIDVFIEMIDFSETRSYVEIVTENYVRYRRLYP